MYGRDLQRHLGLGYGSCAFRYYCSLCILDHIGKSLPLSGVSHKYFHCHRSILTLNLRSHHQTGTSVIIQIKVSIVYCDQIYITIQTAIEGKVRHLGIYGVVGRIVHCDHNQVLDLQRLGHIDTPGRITAVVMSQMLSVHINIRRRICSPKFQIILLSLRQIHLIDLLGIIAGSAIIIAVSILAVDGIPGVGKIHKIPLVGQRCRYLIHHLGERPFCIQIDYCSQFTLPPNLIFVLL